MGIRFQRPVPGGRDRLHLASSKKIQAAIRETAKHFKCSKNFVQNVALGEFFGIDVEHYDPKIERRRTIRVVARRAR